MITAHHFSPPMDPCLILSVFLFDLFNPETRKKERFVEDKNGLCLSFLVRIIYFDVDCTTPT